MRCTRISSQILNPQLQFSFIYVSLIFINTICFLIVKCNCRDIYKLIGPQNISHSNGFILFAQFTFIRNLTDYLELGMTTGVYLAKKNKHTHILSTHIHIYVVLEYKIFFPCITYIIKFNNSIICLNKIETSHFFQAKRILVVVNMNTI